MECWKRCTNPGKRPRRNLEEGCTASLERKQGWWVQDKEFKEQGLTGPTGKEFSRIDGKVENLKKKKNSCSKTNNAKIKCGRRYFLKGNSEKNMKRRSKQYISTTHRTERKTTSKGEKVAKEV